MVSVGVTISAAKGTQKGLKKASLPTWAQRTKPGVWRWDECGGLIDSVAAYVWQGQSRWMVSCASHTQWCRRASVRGLGKSRTVDAIDWSSDRGRKVDETFDEASVGFVSVVLFHVILISVSSPETFLNRYVVASFQSCYPDEWPINCSKIHSFLCEKLFCIVGSLFGNTRTSHFILLYCGSL